MRDRDIRAVLDADLRRLHPPDDTVIYHEFGVAHGASRIDIGLVNGSLEGFEIKSDQDTLRRLPAQVEAYNRVFDRVTIVASGSHVDRLFDIVPPWWGVQRAVEGHSGVEIHDVRPGAPNPDRDAAGLAQLLWRDELIAALEDLDVLDGNRSKPKRALQDVLTGILPLDDVAALVRCALKSRDWRSDR